MIFAAFSSFTDRIYWLLVLTTNLVMGCNGGWFRFARVGIWLVCLLGDLFIFECVALNNHLGWGWDHDKFTNLTRQAYGHITAERKGIKVSSLFYKGNSIVQYWRQFFQTGIYTYKLYCTSKDFGFYQPWLLCKDEDGTREHWVGPRTKERKMTFMN